MSGFDIGVILLMLASILAGARRGVVRSLVGIAALVFGVFFATREYSVAGNFIRPWVGDGPMAYLVAFVSLMLLALLLGAAIGRTIQGVLRSADMGWVDRLFGAGFGLVRGWLVGSIAYLILTAFSFGPSLIGSSLTSPYLRWGADQLRSVSSSEFTKRMQVGWQAAPAAASEALGGR